MKFTQQIRRYGATLLVLGTSNCTFLETVLDGVGDTSPPPRFTYATMEPVPGAPAQDTIHLYSAIVLETGKSSTLNEYIPFPDRTSYFTRIRMSPTGRHVALGFDEPFPGGFDSWIRVLDHELNVEYSASDDVIGSDIRNGCDTSGPEFLADFGDSLAAGIAGGSFPQGSTGLVKWGEGPIISGGFSGWLSGNSFVVFIVNDPPRFVIEPGNPTPFELGPGLTENTIYVSYEKSGSEWQTVGCSLDVPIIPPRPAPLRDLSLADGTGSLPLGVILLDGAELLDANGGRTTGSFVAKAVDGPFGN